MVGVLLQEGIEINGSAVVTALAAVVFVAFALLKVRFAYVGAFLLLVGGMLPVAKAKDTKLEAEKTKDKAKLTFVGQARTLMMAGGVLIALADVVYQAPGAYADATNYAEKVLGPSAEKRQEEERLRREYEYKEIERRERDKPRPETDPMFR